MLLEYFRCYADHLAQFELGEPVVAPPGFFKFGEDTICYGRCSKHTSSSLVDDLPEMSAAIDVQASRIHLPFDVSEVVDNLRLERYPHSGRVNHSSIDAAGIQRRIYYFVRPILPVQVRKHLQKARLRAWEQIAFPRWPVDYTVDALLRNVLALVLKTTGLKRIPFIWFWPEGASGCAIMTHDVETLAGRNFCDRLMDWDNSFAIKSAFQLIPEVRYEVPAWFLENLRRRGFEFNVHDLNHDGHLFDDREEFLRRAAEINRYMKEFHCQGFRAGAMYRNQEWFDAFDCSYDMSVPSVAHMEAQRGGCCTVMPFFIGKILELPMTAIQDYSLFHILGNYSIDLWKQQIELILRNNGLITLNCHPDYLIESRAQAVYLELLAYLAQLRTDRKVWIALPAEVNRWWRARSQMVLIPQEGGWHIEGPERDRARIAYAYLDKGQLAYSLDPEGSAVAPDRGSVASVKLQTTQVPIGQKIPHATKNAE